MEPRLTEKKLADVRAYIEHKAGAIRRPNGRWLRRQEIRLQNRLVRRWKAQMKWIIEEMAALSVFKDDAQKSVRRIETKEINDEVNALLDALPESVEIIDELVITARATYKKGAQQAIDDLRLGEIGISFDIVNDEAVRYLENLKTVQLSDYRGSITRTTKDRIKRILVESVEKGRSYSETARLIREQGDAGVFSQARGELISVNQVGRAYGDGNLELVQQFVSRTGSLVEKFWQTVEDDRVTPECAANEDSGWIGMQESWPSGDMAAPRASNPRCRCVTTYRVVDTQGNPT